MGQRTAKTAVTPVTTTKAGTRPNISVSVKVSKAVMPRVILRTVAPAKELACQSEENRCTLAKASRPMVVMARALSRFSTKVTSCRDTWNRAPSAMKIPSAWMAGQGFSGTPEAMASTSQPAATGMDTSTRVEAMRTPSSMPNNLGESSQ